MTSAERGGHLTFKVDHDPNNYMKQTGDYRYTSVTVFDDLYQSNLNLIIFLILHEITVINGLSS